MSLPCPPGRATIVASTPLTTTTMPVTTTTTTAPPTTTTTTRNTHHQVTKLIAEIDPKTKEQKKSKYIKNGGICIARITVEKPICIECFADVPSLGRFTLRDEGRTIAIGKVTKLPKIH